MGTTTTKLKAVSVWTDDNSTDTEHQSDIIYSAGTPAASQPLVFDESGDVVWPAGGSVTGLTAPIQSQGVSFTEDGSGTSYTGTIAIPANTLVLDIQFRSTVLWDGTNASLVIGDDDDANGYLTATDLKATDMLVGEVFQMGGQTESWLGNNGVYLVAATGLKSATYYAAANNIIAVVTPGAADGSAGRSFMHVFYASPTLAASTNV